MVPLVDEPVIPAGGVHVHVMVAPAVADVNVTTAVLLPEHLG